jgi:hypothetical protein
MDALEKDMARFARGEAQAGHKTPSRTVRVAQGAAMAGWLALWATGGTSCGKTGIGSSRDAGALDGKMDTSAAPDGPLVVDMAPPPADARTDGPLVVDALPPDSGPRADTPVFDPLPPDANPRDLASDATAIDGGAGDVADVAKEGPIVVDMVPWPSDARDLPSDMRGFVVDPPPPPSDARDLPKETQLSDPLPPDSGPRDVNRDVRDAGTNEAPLMMDPVVDARLGLQTPSDMPGGHEAATREHWANTAPTRLKRSQDLPLCLCPEVRLAGEWQGGKILARLSGVTGTFGVRWQAQGQVDGDGGEVLWTPSSDEDQLDVAVRTRDGVAVTSLRLGNASGRKDA